MRYKTLLLNFVFALLLGSQTFAQLRLNFSQETIDSLKSVIQKQEGKTKVDNLARIAFLYQKINPQKTIQYADSALILSIGLKYEIGQVKALRQLAYGYYFSTNEEKAIDLIEQAFDMADDIGWEKGKAIILCDIGLVYYDDGNFSETNKYYTRSLNLFKQINDPAGISSVYYHFGTLYLDIGDFENATKSYLKMLEITDSLEPDLSNIDRINIAGACNNIALIYETTKSFHQAEEYFHKAYSTYNRMGDEIGMAEVMYNLGELANQMQDQTKAHECFTKALDILSPLDYNKMKYPLLEDFALTHYALENYEEALVFFSKAAEYYRENNFNYDLAVTYTSMAHAYIKTGELDKAKNINNKAYSLAKSSGANDLVKDCYLIYSDLFAMKNIYQESLKYFRLYNSLKDSLISEKSNEQIARMLTIYETEKKEKENEILRKDAQIRGNIQKLLVVSLIASILLAGFLFYIFKTKAKLLFQTQKLHEKDSELNLLHVERLESEKDNIQKNVFAEQRINKLQKEKFDSELTYKNRELASSTLNIINKNEVLTTIKSMLEENIKIDRSEDNVKELYSLIRNNIDAGQNWLKFKTVFEETYPNFFDRLKSKVPGLSENETKLCAYLRINLTSKEISSLMFITEAAVSKSRNRLRKKLSLSPDENLNKYLGKLCS